MKGLENCTLFELVCSKCSQCPSFDLNFFYLFPFRLGNDGLDVESTCGTSTYLPRNSMEKVLVFPILNPKK